MPNQIQIIAPYLHHGTWVFDDDRVGLVQEPFVSGVPEMIDDLVKDIPHASDGFRLLFSTGPFPGYQRKLTWVREEMVGTAFSFVDASIRQHFFVFCVAAVTGNWFSGA